jgi:hypothetical protein
MKKTARWTIVAMIGLSGARTHPASVTPLLAHERQINLGATARSQKSHSGEPRFSDQSWVTVERDYGIFGHRAWTARDTVFEVEENVNTLSLRWADDYHRIADCNCGKHAVTSSDARWREVDITHPFFPAIPKIEKTTPSSNENG